MRLRVIGIESNNTWAACRDTVSDLLAESTPAVRQLRRAAMVSVHSGPNWHSASWLAIRAIR